MIKIFYNRYGFYTLLKKEIVRFTKVYIQSMIAPLLSNMLFLGVFGGMLKTREVGLSGVGYLEFLVPGLISMGAIFAAFQNPSFSLIAQKYQGILQDINAYPLSSFEKVMAFVLGGTARGVMIGSMTYLATIYFIGYKIEHPFMFIFLLIIASFIFASVGAIAGLHFHSFEKMSFMLAIVLTPLAYFGGVFFEISRLPGILADLAKFNPLFPLINMVRYAYLGVYEGNFTLQFIYIFVFAFSSFLIAFLSFKKGVGLTN